MFGWHLIIEYGLYIGLKFFLSITEQITNLTKNLIVNGSYGDASVLLGTAAAAEIAPIISKIPGLKKSYNKM